MSLPVWLLSAVCLLGMTGVQADEEIRVMHHHDKEERVEAVDLDSVVPTLHRDGQVVVVSVEEFLKAKLALATGKYAFIPVPGG